LQGRSGGALRLLKDELPANLADKDLAIRRYMFLAMAYARLGEFNETASNLYSAQLLADSNRSALQGELFSIRGVIDVER